jgi:hypothetical protein
LKDLTEQNERENLRTLAILALGNAAKNNSPESAMSTASFVKDAAEAYTKSTQVNEKILWLAALGNAGHNAAFETLSKAATHSDPELRAQAAYSLRFLTHPEQAALLQTLLADTTDSVRTRAAQALLESGSPQTTNILLQHLAHEESATLRMQILRGLWLSQKEHARVRPTLEQAARDDASPRVRTFAQSLLNPQ